MYLERIAGTTLERTFLAWVRTGLGLMTGRVWLESLAAAAGE